MPNRNNNIPMIQQAREAMTQIITRINNTNPATEEVVSKWPTDPANNDHMGRGQIRWLH